MRSVIAYPCAGPVRTIARIDGWTSFDRFLPEHGHPSKSRCPFFLRFCIDCPSLSFREPLVMAETTVQGLYTEWREAKQPRFLNPALGKCRKKRGLDNGYGLPGLFLIKRQ
jgi:hypothetical protein